MTAAGGDRAVMLAHGVAMPLVGLGTWQVRGRPGHDALRQALDVGYRLIDTATMYGNEAEVGRAVRDSGLPRRDVFVTTKLPPDNAGGERETIARSLRALHMEYVDLWLVHWPPRVGRDRTRGAGFWRCATRGWRARSAWATTAPGRSTS